MRDERPDVTGEGRLGVMDANVRVALWFCSFGVRLVSCAVGLMSLLALGSVWAEGETHATLSAGDLVAVVGDNAPSGGHRKGYNGVWSLTHSRGGRSVFVPAYSGLNLEHIVTGDAADEDGAVFFEPRHAGMEFRRMEGAGAELHQPATPMFGVESWTQFRLVAPHYLDMSFRCVPRKAVFSRGYLGLFWASYMDAPTDKSIYFLGGLGGQPSGWVQFCTQSHNDQSTVRHRADGFEMSFAPSRREALFKQLSPLRFDRPFFYGNHEELTWIVMFDRREGIRFTHSPSGGGFNEGLQTTNPAWDFQFIIQKPEVGKEYGFRVRTVLRPRCTRLEILEEMKRWEDSL